MFCFKLNYHFKLMREANLIPNLSTKCRIKKLYKTHFLNTINLNAMKRESIVKQNKKSTIKAHKYFILLTVAKFN